VQRLQALYDTARVAWEGANGHSAAELLRTRHDDADEEASALAEAEGFLRELLADGPMRTKDLQREAREAGLAWRTVERAKATLGVVAERVGRPGPGGDAAYYWLLPAGGPTTGSPPTRGPTPSSVSASQGVNVDSGESWSASSANRKNGGGPSSDAGLNAELDQAARQAVLEAWGRR
jgi:hypothetical protein